MDKLIGRRLDGRYEIEGIIGAGGMANVYRAKDLLENRTVAVKVLRDEFLDNEELLRRFKNESKAIALLSHPNIVKVFDVNFSESVQYIVMEYIDGITLKDFIDHKKVLTWKEALHFTVQILRALQHAHDRGIVHRDIKPQNVMLLADGSIKVMDFGIARMSRSDVGTLTDKAIGSVHYISPEQAKGASTDAKSDIYSVGVMLYEMLTGQLPFVSDSPVQVAIKQISDKPVAPREINPEIPIALEDITLRAMAKNPDNRYQSAEDMLEDIDEFKNNPSVRFEYTYFDDQSPTKYVDTLDTEQFGLKKAKRESKKIGFMPILYGVTAAVFVGCAILVALIFKMSGNQLFSNAKDVELPYFVGLNYEEVINSKEYKFKFEVEEVYSDTYDEGVICNQYPKPPKLIKENSSVTIKVSKGTNLVPMPNVTSLSEEEATELLRESGFYVIIDTMYSEDVPIGCVVKSEPEEGVEVSAGSYVTIYVSSDIVVPTVVVPTVVGSDISEARLALLTFLLRVQVVEVDSSAPKGEVLSQSPEGGSVVVEGTLISLEISKGVPAVVEQNVVAFDSQALPTAVYEDVEYLVKLNGDTAVTSGTVNPSLNPTLSFEVWGPLETTGQVDLYLDGKLLYTYVADFETGLYTVTTDNFSSFSGWVSSGQTVNTAASAVQTALNAMTVSAATTENDMLSAAKAVVTNANIAVTSSNFGNDGTNISIQIKLKKGSDEKTVSVSRTISTALAGISLPPTAGVAVGSTVTLTVTYNPTNASNKSLTWNTGDPNIATVIDGVVTGVSAGTTTITATSADGGHVATCTVTVG